YVAEGDMRRAVNALQVAASLGSTVDAEVLYKVSSTVRPEEVKGLIEKALEGEFLRAREVLDRLLIEYGLSGEDIVRQLHRTVFDLNIPDESKVRLLDRIGETDFRLTEGSSERIQIESLLAHFALTSSLLKTISSSTSPYTFGSGERTRRAAWKRTYSRSLVRLKFRTNRDAWANSSRRAASVS